MACSQPEDPEGERPRGDHCLLHDDAGVPYFGRGGEFGAVVAQDAGAAAGIDDHQETPAAKIGQGVSVVQDLQAAAGPEFGVRAAGRDQVLDQVQQRVLVGTLPGDGGAVRVRIDRKVETSGRGGGKSRVAARVELVRDAGRIQVAPGTLTCCAAGPADSDRIDAATAGLSLM